MCRLCRRLFTRAACEVAVAAAEQVWLARCSAVDGLAFAYFEPGMHSCVSLHAVCRFSAISALDLGERPVVRRQIAAGARVVG